ncbi:MAG: LuxR C-terminal-related transcriptional regulator [Cohaesibacter sp.]|jgi:pimeloyl-ACP methyl ester carboxylesterase/DNA-binding CsgD family transcriptional regulator|nr:LuxR C-terminal-related transcriptional regulator [Cohaesibacter sp.]
MTFNKTIQPSDQSPQNKNSNDEGQHAKLLQALYGFLSDPNDFQEFLTELDDQLISLGQDHLSAQDFTKEYEDFSKSSNLDHHFACAAQIFDRIGLADATAASTTSSNKLNNPEFLLDGNGIVLSMNASASQMFDSAEIGKPSFKILDDPDFHAFLRDEINRPAAKNSNQLRVYVHTDPLNHQSQKLFLLTQNEEQKEAYGTVFSLICCQLGWKHAIGLTLETSFGLSSAEQEVLKGVVEGKSFSDIAEERGRSVQTIRTQSKSLLRKTGAKSQAGLVRLFAAICLSVPSLREETESSIGKPFHHLRSNMVGFDGMPQLQVDEYGSATGFPVIMFHGLFTGTGLTEQASAYVASCGLRIIAPWRPDWGQSGAFTGDRTKAPELFARQIEELLKHYNFEQVALVGRFTGCIYAAATAQRLASRAIATILVSPTQPIVDKSELRQMEGWQRIFAYAITYTPSVVPILVRGMRQFLFRKEVSKFMEGFYGSPMADIKARNLPEIQALIAEQVEQSFAQGTQAHERDLMLTGSNWTRYLEGIVSPVLSIHGQKNPVDKIETIRGFTRYCPHMQLLELEDRGQLFVHSEPALLWGHIRQFIQDQR